MTSHNQMTAIERKEKTMPLSSIKMESGELMDRIRENRASHKAEFETAHAAWREVYLTGLARIERMITDGRPGVGKELRKFMGESPEPVSHDAEYATALQMLDLAVEDEIVVHAHEFRQLVRDEWDWKDRWAATNELYSGAVR